MRYVEAGGARLSAIGLGTWQFGSREWGYGQQYAEGESGAIVTRALDLGINLIDTAEIYGFGRSEKVLGEVLVDRRDEAFIATTVGWSSSAFCEMSGFIQAPPRFESRVNQSARNRPRGVPSASATS